MVPPFEIKLDPVDLRGLPAAERENERVRLVEQDVLTPFDLRTGPLKSYEQHGFGLFLTILRDDCTSIGICGLLKRDELDDPDVGFAFLPRYRSRGYALESAAAVLEFGGNELGMRRIVAITSPDNQSSIRLLQKIGLQYEETIQLGEETNRVNVYEVELK